MRPRDDFLQFPNLFKNSSVPADIAAVNERLERVVARAQPRDAVEELLGGAGAGGRGHLVGDEDAAQADDVIGEEADHLAVGLADEEPDG
jgi:hypothetical protein